MNEDLITFYSENDYITNKLKSILIRINVLKQKNKEIRKKINSSSENKLKAIIFKDHLEDQYKRNIVEIKNLVKNYNDSMDYFRMYNAKRLSLDEVLQEEPEQQEPGQ